MKLSGPGGGMGGANAEAIVSLVPEAARTNGTSPRGGSAAPDGAGRVRTYEELDGAEGRAVFFRPHRYTAADLAPLRGIVGVTLGGVDHQLALRDVSQNGLAFPWPGDQSVQQGQRIPLRLRFGKHELFRGDARVGSVRDQDGSIVVGASFDDFLLDIDDVLQLREVHRWKDQRDGPLLREDLWRIPGGDRFRALVAELRVHLQDAKRQLDDLEARLPWHVLQGQDNPARVELVDCLREDLAGEVVRFSEELDAAVRPLPEGHRSAAAREWSQRHLDEFLMQAPVLHRARHKPFGYPGDYEVMHFIYEREFEGATLFARAVGLGFWRTRAALAVRTRKDLVKRELRSLLQRSASDGRPLRILSIASGSAQELHELFGELKNPPTPVEVVLFEQDKNALAHAWRRLSPGVEQRFRGSVRLVFLHDSVKRLLRDEDLFASFGQFDLIYSCGLYDYLQRTTAVVLTRRLLAATVPSGRLLVANMVDHPTRWLMEMHLDWRLIYRTREELLEIGRRADPHARSCILEEESGVNPFLALSRD
jgi:extracellular factor (EF) 3-hydroxypalmitic acid methyl ester biosynthesis protein